MPRKRRDKKISLTQTKKKGLQGKHKLVDEIRNIIDDYEHIFVFSYQNMRNSKMQEIKIAWNKSSRFLLGKNKVMALALGRTSAEEVSENLHLISEKLVGQRGLFFTNKPKKEVLEHFDALQSPDFARAGNVATETVELPEGLLSQFSHTLEPQLRKLGLPTKLERGIPALVKAHTVCKEGDVLNPEQAKILKLLGHQQAKFKITFEFIWSKDGSFEDLGRTKMITASKKHRKHGIKHTNKDKKKKEKKKAKETSDGEENEDQENSDDGEDDGMEGDNKDGDSNEGDVISDKEELMEASDDE